MIKPSTSKAKKILKDALIVLAPLIVVALVVIGVFYLSNLDDRGSGATFTREELLYDFDYLITALEENFPSFGIIYRRNGVDMFDIAQDVRGQLANESSNLNLVNFWRMLRDDFFYYAHPVGHLRIADYEARRQFGEAVSFHPVLAESTLLGDHRNLAGSSTRIVAPLPAGPLIDTRILEEGRIAYLGVNGFMPLTIHDTNRRTLDTFYQNIADFEHLIIDMRDSRGGYSVFFTNYVAPPLVGADAIFATRTYTFYKAGTHNIEFMQRLRAPLGTPFHIDNVSTMFRGESLSQEIIEDLSSMDFFFIDTFNIARVPANRRSPFQGKIWMLVGEHMFSASQSIATLVSDSGFATLVGETTGGMVAATRLGSNFFELPNTGIIIRYDHAFITDSRGRPLEYGTEPHYFNRPGMDALETVLALIEEGWYRYN